MRLLILLFLCMVCASQSTPVSKSNATDVIAPRFDFDLAAGLKVLLMDFYRNLGNAVDQAKESVETFTKGVETQWAEFLQRVDTRLENFQGAIEEYVQSFTEKLSDVGDTVNDCIEENKEMAQHLYNQTLASVTQCGTNRVEAIGEMITNLATLTETASSITQEVHSEVDRCYNTTGKEPLPLAQCLVSVVVDAELKATGFLAQTGYQVWNINLSLAALPASLEVCAGAGLIDAGIDTGTVFREIASCLASSAMEYFTSNSTPDYNKINSTLFRFPKL